MDESSFRQLKHELIQAAIVGTYLKKELVLQDARRPTLKVCMYKEPNHKRPHIHVYFGPETDVSICLKTREILAGASDSKLLKPIKLWIEEHEAGLARAWDDIQRGEKPELLWPQKL